MIIAEKKFVKLLKKASMSRKQWIEFFHDSPHIGCKFICMEDVLMILAETEKEEEREKE